MPFSYDKINMIIEQCRLEKNEVPWLEFKVGNSDPNQIGEYVSALSNSAALFNKDKAYMIWGIDDKTHDIVGTNFDPQTTKQGNQSIELWIASQLEPQIQFYFYKTIIDDKNLVLLEINCANSSPVKFRSVDYIRIDSHKTKLKNYPDTERELWAIFSQKPFEVLTALENVSADFVLRLLDYAAYFEMLEQDLPADKKSIIEILLADGMIVKADTGNYNITNLGALLFAKRITDFPSLERKAVRVIKYNGNDRISAASKEQVGGKGYANGFQGLIDYINNLLPVNEVMGKALRKAVPMYPELAVRELVANAIIHQNLYLHGTSPMIEIFNDRMEITNPGIPLIERDRFIDYPPVSRNEKLASFMRRIGVCEERGSGFDKVVANTETYQLPAPEIEIYANNTKVILFAHKEFAKMSKLERQHACYLHSCLKRVNREYMTNASLRERFNIDIKNSSMISRLLKETCDSGKIKLTEDSSGDKNRKYMPYWG
ncbi:MAG: ATP-binding protein [Clostridia bacterium]